MERNSALWREGILLHCGGTLCTVEGHYANKKFNAGAILPDWLMPQADPGTEKGGAREIMPTQDLKVVYLSANAMIRLDR